MSRNAPSDPFGEISIARPTPCDAAQKPADARKLPSPLQPSFSRQSLPPRKPATASVLLALLGLGLAIYLACGYLILPYLIKTVATRTLAHRLDRPVTIGQVEFNPFTLSLAMVNGIIGPRLSDPTDKIDPILSFSRLTLNLEAVSLPRRVLICRELSISQPFLHLVHDQKQGYNLSTLLPDHRQPRPATHMGADWLAAILARRYSINNITISKGEVLFDDLPTAKVHHLEELDVSLPAITNTNYQNGHIEPHFSAVINGTPVEMSGQAQMTEGPMKASLSMKMTNLDLAAYQEYLPPTLGVKGLSGQADLDLDLLYAAASPQAEKLRLVGTATLRNAQGATEQGQFSVDSGLIKGWFAPLANQFQADEITLQHPVWTWRSMTNQAKRWPALIGAALRSAPGPQGTLPLNHLQITKGEIRDPSNSAPQPPEGDWQDIEAAINTAQSPGDKGGQQQAFFSLSAKKTTGSRITLQGSASSAPFVAKGLLVVNQVEISTIQGLGGSMGLTLPVQSGRVEQIQSNFSVSIGPDQRYQVLLDPLSLQAKDLRVEHNGQVLEIPIWQSEQGSFTPSDPTLRLGKVRLQQPKIICRRQSSTAAWQTIVSQAAVPSPPLGLDLDALELTNASLLIENQGPPDISLRLERFDLQVDQLDPHKPNSLSAAAMLDDKYPVQVTGTFSWSPFSANLNIQASDLPLTTFQPVLARYFAIPIDGRLSVDGSLSLPSLAYNGQWSINSLSAPPISCRRLTGEGTAFILRPLSLTIDRLALEGPALQVTANQDGMPQLPAIMAPGWQPAPTLQQAAVTIKSIELEDGSLIYDLPGPPGLTISNQKISGRLDDFIVAQDQAIPFSLNGLMETTAEFQAQGAIRPFATPPGLSLKGRITGLPLLSLAPLLEPYWGFTIKTGTLDFYNQLTFEDTLIQDNSQLALQDLSFGKPLATPAIKAIGNTWQSLPLVQAMLQDAADTIKLTVPIDGRTDAGFTYQTGMRTFLNQLLLKASVSPMNLLADHQKTVLSDTVEFQAGSSRLEAAAEDQLRELAALLQDRPLLAVSLAGFADKAADAKPLLSPQKAADRQAAKPPELNSEIALLNLANKRGQATKKFLTTQGVPPQQISLAPPEVISAGKTARPGRRVTIGIGVAP